MPKLRQLLEPPKNPDGSPKTWSRTDSLASLQTPPEPPMEAHEPYANPTLRCPMPPISLSSSDNLRQFYRFGSPQFRVWVSPHQ